MPQRFSPPVVALCSVVIAVLAALALLAMGRTPICTCGFVKLWHGEVLSSQNSQHFADPYTFTHILHGVGLYFILWAGAGRRPLGLRGIVAVFMESAWEVFENTAFVINRYRTATFALDYFGDSVVNSVGDILVAAGAFWLTARLPLWVTVVGVMLVEAVLLLSIRDNLTLGILMLVYPLDAVKAWQLGT